MIASLKSTQILFILPQQVNWIQRGWDPRFSMETQHCAKSPGRLPELRKTAPAETDLWEGTQNGIKNWDNIVMYVAIHCGLIHHGQSGWIFYQAS